MAKERWWLGDFRARKLARERRIRDGSYSEIDVLVYSVDWNFWYSAEEKKRLPPVPAPRTAEAAH